MSTTLLIAALLPAAVLLAYVYHKDKVEKEPPALVARVFVLGVVAGPIAAIAETVVIGLFEGILPEGALLLVLEYFVGVAAIEEALKYLALATVRNNPAFNYVFDGIVYAVAAALGFAALENVLYVLDGGIEVAVTRALFSVPGHCADGVVMGCFFGLAKQRAAHGNAAGARAYYWLAFLLPVLEHGFYDAALSTDSDLMVLLALVVEVAFIAVAMVLVNRMSKNDAPIAPVQAHAPYRAGAPYQAASPYQAANPQQPVASAQNATSYQGASPAQAAVPYQPAAPVQAYPAQVPQASMGVSGSWICPRCGSVNAGNFCGECGAPRVQPPIYS